MLEGFSNIDSVDLPSFRAQLLQSAPFLSLLELPKCLLLFAASTAAMGEVDDGPIWRCC